MHRKALRTQRFFMSSVGSREERWSTAAAWSQWYSLLKNAPFQIDAVGLLTEAANRILALAPENCHTWARSAVSPGAVWHHPVAEALVRLNDGDGVDESWLIPLMDSTQAYPSEQPWVSFEGRDFSYTVPIQALAIMAVLERSAVRADLSIYKLARDLEVETDPWAWCRNVVREIPALGRFPDFWAQNPDAALDAILFSDFRPR